MKVEVLKNKNGENFYPLSHTKSTYDDNGESLDDLLDNKVDKEEGKSLVSNEEIERLSHVNNYDDSEIKSDLSDIQSNVSLIGKNLENKVEKVQGKSLILDTEIERLSGLHNYDDTEIKSEIDKKADKSEVELIGTSTTSPITDSANGCIRDFEAFGKCEQGENPSPDSPQEIKSWDGKITTRNSDGTLQSVADLGISLYGIKVASGGNYTDSSGQQWLCDKIDMGKGVIVRAFGQVDLGSLDYAIHTINIGFLYRASVPNIKDVTDNSVKANIFCDHYRTTSISNRANYTIQQRSVGQIDIVNNDTYQTVQDFKQANAGVIVFYELATPTTEPLTDAQIIALRQLQTYSDGTFVEYGGIEPFASVGYWIDTKNGKAIAEVDAKVNQLFALLINPQNLE